MYSADDLATTTPLDTEVILEFVTRQPTLQELAAKRGLPPFAFLTWWHSEPVQAALESVLRFQALRRDLQNEPLRSELVAILAEVAKTSPDPVERRRAATTGLRACDAPFRPGRWSGLCPAGPRRDDDPPRGRPRLRTPALGDHTLDSSRSVNGAAAPADDEAVLSPPASPGSRGTHATRISARGASDSVVKSEPAVPAPFSSTRRLRAPQRAECVSPRYDAVDRGAPAEGTTGAAQPGRPNSSPGSGDHPLNRPHARAPRAPPRYPLAA